jgi:hypothetical protein
MTLLDLSHPCNTPLFFFVWQLFGHKGLLRHRIILETLRFRDLPCIWFPKLNKPVLPLFKIWVTHGVPSCFFVYKCLIRHLVIWKTLCFQGFKTWILFGCRVIFWFFLASGFGFFLGFLSRYHLPCICNSLELEPVILHGICYILAWALCILRGICYIWQRLCSILHGICHILAFQPLICMAFITF